MVKEQEARGKKKAKARRAGDIKVNKSMKRRITKCALLLAAIITVVFASGIIKSFIRAETAAVKIEKNGEYFRGDTGMGAVEIVRSSAEAVSGVIDFVLTALIMKANSVKKARFETLSLLRRRKAAH